MDIVTPAGAAAAGLCPSFRRVAALAAAFWSAGFALVHLYWLLGGRAGRPVGAGQHAAAGDRRRRDTAVRGGRCPGAGAAVGRAAAGPQLLWAARGTAVVLIVHAAPSVPDRAALAAGHRSVAEPAATARFATLLYEPFFLAGGVLFGCAVFGRRLLPGDDGRR
ncbi:DUF3995 domain-containing protein [Kitasatospora griseola]|uniref:DUF3995 domain-containing protein n=1 Tax=Kitasatospora griseola TaxID=2064 RepID=UPI003855EB15